MNESIIELPSGRMVNIDNIIYISDIKNKHRLEGDQWYFDVLWANGQKVRITFINQNSNELTWKTSDKCSEDWYALKLAVKNQTNKMICS